MDRSLERLARSFLFFGDRKRNIATFSPLYARLSSSVANDPEILALAAQAMPGQPVPNLLFGAVHYLLLTGALHPLAAFYPSLTQTPNTTDDPYPAFRAFCQDSTNDLLHLLTTRRVQTNEVRRCACLLPAFGLVAAQAPERPLAQIELGCSAGLNLLWDRYSYAYSDGQRSGEADAPLHLACQLRGERHPPILATLPRVVSRVGVDLNPIDLHDPDALLWLRALIWPEHHQRAEQFQRAVEVARQHPPQVLAGDALELVSWLLEHAPAEAVPCLFDSFVFNQVPREMREHLDMLLCEASTRRDLFRISFDWYSDEQPRLDLYAHHQGNFTRQHLAWCDSHGGWIEWLV